MKISVLTPSFNSAQYIENAINSVLKQKYNNWEHIIIDGESNDGTLEILKKYHHLRWVSEKDNGQSDAMNKAFRLATGDVIVYLNADDWFADDVFKTVINYYNKRPKTRFLVGDVIKVFENRSYRDTPSTSLSTILNCWPCKFPLNPVSYFYRREVQEEIGEFPSENHYVMDYWFLLEAYKRNKIDYIHHDFGYFQLFSGKSADRQRAQIALRVVRNNFLKRNKFIFPGYFLKKAELDSIICFNSLKGKLKSFLKK